MVKQIPYSVIKAGIHMMTQYIATYYGKYNVRSNAIAPGGVWDHQPEPFVKNYEKKTPLGPNGVPRRYCRARYFIVYYLSCAYGRWWMDYMVK